MNKKNKIACIGKNCTACGRCVKECPKQALSIYKGMSAVVEKEKCIGCGICENTCPAAIINIGEKIKSKPLNKGKKYWHNYMWIFSSVYLILGFFNILFAWLGLICFITPLLISIIKGTKSYCGKYCGRGQLFELLGGKLNLSLKNKPPKFLSSPWFRYGFLTFFMTMFIIMIYNTYLVFTGAELNEVITLFWAFKISWGITDISFAAPWIAQFSFGFYSVMATSTILGLITMLLFKPRSWCIYCPMGTMTQGICKIKQIGKHDEKILNNPIESDNETLETDKENNNEKSKIF